MELFAISDLHVGFEVNRRALQAIRPRKNAALVLAGDIGETRDHLAATLDVLLQRFQRVAWCPGNHELWRIGAQAERGQSKYEQLVHVCRTRGVLTPEDDYPIWRVGGEPFLIVPMFLLYDYSFRPDHVPEQDAVTWAAETGVVCADEELLDPHPYPSRAAWCAARCAWTEQRIERAQRDTQLRTILINHFPLKRCLAQLPAIPRFQIWCGTRRTEDWHLRFRAAVTISGHLHWRTTRVLDGCRFEEVSLGYPGRQWCEAQGIDHYLRPIVADTVDAKQLHTS